MISSLKEWCLHYVHFVLEAAISMYFSCTLYWSVLKTTNLIHILLIIQDYKLALTIFTNLILLLV